MPPVVSIENACKAFGAVEVLRGISLEVARGEVVAVIGPSGSGKSTFLRCMTLLERLDAGSLSYGEVGVATSGSDGASVYAGRDMLKRARGSFGLVFQNYNLFPHFTVLRNIMDAPIRVQRRDRAEVERGARDLIERMGLTDCADKVPCQLSGGQQQRAAIARALALNPKMIYFDEPTSALDPELTAGVLRVIRGLADERMTMVVVTHEMDFAREVADRVVFMDGGMIVEEGPARQVLENPRKERTRAFLARMER